MLDGADAALHIARSLDDPESSLNMLLALFEGLPPLARKTMQDVIAELNDVLRRRTSRLYDSSVWSELKLPEGLKALLHR